MKSILISIHPEWIIKIFNGDKTAEIRRTAPKEWKDYLSGKTKKKPEPMTVYIYCTQGRPLVFGSPLPGWVEEKYCQTFNWNKEEADKCFESGDLCGKVVAKFVLEEVEKIRFSKLFGEYRTDKYEHITFCEKTRVSGHLMHEYFKGKGGYAWHISDLQIFDEPKELDEFEYLNPSGTRNIGQRSINGLPSKKHPPQSWCYVEAEE